MRFIGDIHGDFNRLISKLKTRRIRNENLIQVGDFGMGFRSVKDDMLFMNKLNDSLAENGNRLFVIRGNHDDPKFFDGSIDMSNLQLLPDYSVLSLEGKTLFLAGGAISVDRGIRKLDLNYWKDEVFVFDGKKLNSILSSNDKIDIVVTHTAPSFAFPKTIDPIVISYAKNDQMLIHELTQERNLLNNLYAAIADVTKPSYWYYGHFHTSKREMIDGTLFCLLDADEIKSLRS